MNEKLIYLQVPLPEDILKLKGQGDFTRMRRLIDLRLKEDLPQALRERLLLEKEVIGQLAPAYPLSEKEALALLQENFRDFSQEDLDQARDQGALDWFNIDGRVHFKDNMVKNLIKMRPDLKERLKDPVVLDDREAEIGLLETCMDRLKDEGTLATRTRVRASIKLQDRPSFEGKLVLAHLPLPIEYAQVSNVRLEDFSHQTKALAPKDFPARTAFFEEAYQAKMTLSVTYSYQTHLAYQDLDPDRVLTSQPSFYTHEDPPHISFTPYMKSLAEEIVASETNPLIKARKIYDFITSRVKYSFVRPYMSITDLPGYAALNLKGDCGLQALLFIVLARISGVPARWQSGLYTNPKSPGMHDWAQFYVAPYGWLFVDCSFGGSAYREGAWDRWNFYFGNIDPFRMPACSSFQHDFYVPLAYPRKDPYDNQVGEAELEDQALDLMDYETQQEVLAFEDLEGGRQ